MIDIFNRIFQSINTYRKSYSVVLILVFGLLIWMASQIQFDEDISKLIPSNPENEQLQKILNTAQFSDKIIINIKRQPNGSLEDLTDYAQQLLDSLSETSSFYIKDIQGKVEDETIYETLDMVFDHAPLFLSKEDYKSISNKIQKDSIEKLTESNYKLLASPSGIIAKKTVIKDPLGISLLALQNLKQLGFNDDFELKNGFLVSNDEQHILLFISPKFKASETSKNEPFVEQLFRFQNRLNGSFKDKISSEVFGGLLIAVANAKQIKTDIQLTVSIALVALLLVFVLFYKKLIIPFILIVPTLFGGLLSVVILYLIRTEISAISLGIGAVLLGVTLDYSLHILTHIRNNDTVKDLYADVAKPILMSSITTALAFLCLLFIDSQALQDLGIFAAVSVLGASVFALIFIPQAYKVKVVTKPVKTTVIDRVAKYPFHENRWLIGALVLFLIVSTFTYSRVQFNNDISKLNYEPKCLKDAEQHLDKLTNQVSKSLYVIVYGPTMQQALEANDAVYEKLKQLQQTKNLISFNSVAALVSSQATQQKKIKAWKAFWTPEKIQSTEFNLIESSEPFGFKPNTFQEFYTLLKTDFSLLDVEDFKAFNTIPVDDFISSSDDFHTITSIVKVEDQQISIFKNTFENTRNVVVIDRQNLNETLLGHLKDDFNTLILYCSVVVFVLLLLFYRNLKLTLVTIIPIGITWCITIGVMGAFNLEFNIFSILISTFIFGLGVDYSIFMTNGLLKENKALATYKTSVILSVLTTILGIGVLVFAKHPALYSISIVSIIGIISAALIAFTIQPLLFKLLIFNKKQQP
jgi:hypothetical protein